MIIKYDQVLNRLYFNNVSTNGHSIDTGDIQKYPVDDCYNCNTESMFSTVSTHFCIGCGALFNYWGGGGNDKWNSHETKYNNRAPQWIDDDDGYINDDYINY